MLEDLQGLSFLGARKVVSNAKEDADAVPIHARIVVHVPYAKQHERVIAALVRTSAYRIFSQAPGLNVVTEVHTGAKGHSSKLTIDASGVHLYKNVNGYNGAKTRLEDVEISIARMAELEYLKILL